MAEISKINIDNVEYSIKDTRARQPAGTELGAIKSGGDLTIANGVAEVNDNSHKHIVANISDLTATANEINVLDGVVINTTELNTLKGIDTSKTVQKHLTDNLNTAKQYTDTAETNAKKYTDDAEARAQKYTDTAEADANKYTDKAIADLIDSAPETMDTFKEIADAIEEHSDIMDALNAAIGTKANAADLTAHTNNDTIHVTATNKTNWDDAYNKRHTHSNKDVLDATTASFTTADETKLDGIEEKANNYKHPTHSSKTNGLYKVTVDSQGHVSNTVAVTKDDIMNLGIPDQDTTYEVFKGASSKSAGTAGLVPAPDQFIPSQNYGQFLSHLGTWRAVDDSNVTSTKHSLSSADDNLPPISGGKITVESELDRYATVIKKLNDNGVRDIYFNATNNTIYYQQNQNLVPVSILSFVAGENITLTPSQNRTITISSTGGGTSDVATTTTNGLMSSTDKVKLDGIAEKANNYTHPSYTAKASGLYKVTVDSSGHVSATVAVTKSDITGLGIPAQDTTYSAATKNVAGLMSAADKIKLDGVATGANAYTHPTTSGNKHVPSGGSSGQILKWSADGTAVWGNNEAAVVNRVIDYKDKNVFTFANSPTSVVYNYCYLDASEGKVYFDVTTTYSSSIAGSVVSATINNADVHIGSSSGNNIAWYIQTLGGPSQGGFTVQAPNIIKYGGGSGAASAVHRLIGYYTAVTSSNLGQPYSGNDAILKVKNYSLPLANGMLAGAVKTSSTVTSSSGHEACPIISGVPYYKKYSGLETTGGTLTGDVVIPTAKATADSTIPVSGGTLIISSISELPNYKTYIGSMQYSGAWNNIISVRHRNGSSDGNSYGMYIRSALTNEGSMAWGKQYGSGKWQAERTILDSANYTSYLHNQVKDVGNSAATTFAYSKDGLSSASWAAAWNGYELRAITPAKLIASAGAINLTVSSSIIGNSRYLVRTKNSADFNWCNVNYKRDIFGGVYGGVCTEIQGQLILLSSNYMTMTNRNIVTTSDARVKHDSMILNSKTDATQKYLAMWDKLQLRRFKLNDDEADKYYLGYHAQEVEDSLYDSGLNDDDFSGLAKIKDYSTYSDDPEDVEYFDTLYGLSYEQCLLLDSLKLRQVVNEVIPAIEKKHNEDKEQLLDMIANLQNQINELKGEN